MAYTKYLLVAGLCSALTIQPARAQEGGTMATATYSSRDMTYRGENYDVFDSTLIPARRMEQYRRYMNHQYAFPPRPRDQWEIGVHFGQYNIFGDIPSLLAWQKSNSGSSFGSYGLGAHIRKALGYTMSLRADYLYGIGKGMAWQPMGPTLSGVNAAFNGANNGLNQSGLLVFHNYRTEAHHVNLDLIANLSNILFHKAKPTVNMYLFAGAGAMAYGTRVNALNSNFQAYNNEYLANTTIAGAVNGTTGGFTHRNRKDIREALRNIWDDTYETDAPDNNGRGTSFIKNKTTQGLVSVGLGLAFRVSRAFNISIEDRVMGAFGSSDDLLDGQQYEASGARSHNKDGMNYLNVGLNFNLGNRNKTVEPLYWMNPLDYAYNELADPRHMRLPDPILTDSDGDGIADQFDKCPGTPAGVAVDSHGCPMDTDGDGVPDDRDKQLITPTECQPVDADGIGKCPCHCTGLTTSACGNIGAGSLSFSSSSSRISPAMQSQLSTLASQMQANPTCKVVIIGNGSGSKVQQQRSWDRVNAVIEYMSEKAGIDRGRFIFQYGGMGDQDAVLYRSANSGEEGPSNVAPPFPNLRRD
jgi:hypothetical protein